MCLISLQLPGARPMDWDLFDSHAFENPHSIGFAIPRADASRVDVARFIPRSPAFSTRMAGNPVLNSTEIHEAFEAYTRAAGAALDSGRPVLLHFRYATHGEVSESNCHPVRVRRNLVFAHNGVIPSATVGFGKGKRDTRSDTVLLRDRVLNQLDRDFYRDGETLNALDRAAGGSRLAFVDATGGWSLVGESRGAWNADRTVWHSRPYTFRAWSQWEDRYPATTAPATTAHGTRQTLFLTLPRTAPSATNAADAAESNLTLECECCGRELEEFDAAYTLGLYQFEACDDCRESFEPLDSPDYDDSHPYDDECPADDCGADFDENFERFCLRESLRHAYRARVAALAADTAGE